MIDLDKYNQCERIQEADLMTDDESEPNCEDMPERSESSNGSRLCLNRTYNNSSRFNESFF